jgi:uridine kinase
MDKIKITFNGNITKEYPKGTTYYEISKDVHLNNPILGVKINNSVSTLDKAPIKDENIEFFDVTDINAYMMYKSGLKMIFELALHHVIPNADVSFDHSVPKGMLGTIVSSKILDDNDVIKLKNEMNNIIKANYRFKKMYVRKKDAIDFFCKTKQEEKADNIRNIMDGSVTLYNLDNLINYYYCDMPYETSSINKYDLIYLGNNKMVFTFPNNRTKGELPKYIPNDKIIGSFYEGKSWLDKLDMPYVTDLNKVIGSGKVKEFINSTEIMFNLSIANLAKTVLSNNKIKFLLIAGPSSSGKTTTEKRIQEYLQAMGYDPIGFSMDDYFYDREATPKDEFGNYEFESPEAVNINLLNQNVMDLINNKEVKLSRYNFYTGKREETVKTVKMKDNSIILIEGLHSLNDKVLPGIKDELKYKIYLSPFMPLKIDRDNYISTVDLRLLRRIVRDNGTRGHDVSDSIKTWQVVRNGEEKYIFPFINKADVIINTALAYEIGVLKVYLEPLLYSVSMDSLYYEEAQRLLKSLKIYYSIPSEYVSKESILREFIGGKND